MNRTAHTPPPADMLPFTSPVNQMQPSPRLKINAERLSRFSDIDVNALPARMPAPGACSRFFASPFDNVIADMPHTGSGGCAVRAPALASARHAFTPRHHNKAIASISVQNRRSQG